MTEERLLLYMLLLVTEWTGSSMPFEGHRPSALSYGSNKRSTYPEKQGLDTGHLFLDYASWQVARDSSDVDQGKDFKSGAQSGVSAFKCLVGARQDGMEDMHPVRRRSGHQRQQAGTAASYLHRREHKSPSRQHRVVTHR